MSSTSESLDVDIGKRIQAIRNSMGLSQQDMADKLGISMRAYQNYERGDRPVNKQFLCFFSEVFGVDVNFVLFGRSSDGPESRNLVDLVVLESIAISIEANIKKLRDEFKEFNFSPLWFSAGLVYNRLVEIAHSREERLNLIDQEVEYLFKIHRYNLKHDSTEMIHESEQEHIKSVGLQISDVTDKKVVNDKSTVTQHFNKKVGQAAAGDIHNHGKKK